jgi:HK97 family phage major capsid protein
MQALDLLRGEREAVEAKRDAAIEAMESVATAALTEERSLSPEDSAEIEARQAEIVAIDADLAALDEREAELVLIQERTEARAARPSLQVISSPAPADVMVDRSATPQQLADAVTRSLEGKVDAPENMEHVRQLALRHRADGDWARSLILRASDTYESAWGKVITGQHVRLTEEERTALSTVTDANGNYLVPTHLDPTVILTNSGSSNAIRGISRVVTLSRPGDTSWQGITSAGVTASFDAQLAEVSDDSPTFGQASIPVHKAQAFIQASIESAEDIPGLAGELLMMFADSRDRLEGAAHATGTGSDQPTGIFTALDANTNVEIVSDTAAALFKEDLDEVYRSVPVRFRGRSSWLMNPVWALEIQNLGTALSNKYSTNITEGTTAQLYNRPVVESDDAPAVTTTTARDNRIVFGDFSNFVIVDKPGSSGVQYIPTMFNTSNNLPDGRVGWYATWRTGSDSVNDLAFRLLQDKTSA